MTVPEATMTTVEEAIRHRLALLLGGWRGAVETAVPTIAFVAVWMWREDLRTAVIAAVIVAAALAAVRLVQRSSLQHVWGAVVATAIAAAFALRSGRAEDVFLPGIILSSLYGAGTLLSVLVRWPVVGFLVAAADTSAAPDLRSWRRDEAVVRVCARLTWVLVAVYAVRLAVMVPLYLAGNIPALGVAKIVLGWPLWGAGVLVMFALLVRGRTPLTQPLPAPSPR